MTQYVCRKHTIGHNEQTECWCGWPLDEGDSAWLVHLWENGLPGLDVSAYACCKAHAERDRALLKLDDARMVLPEHRADSASPTFYQDPLCHGSGLQPDSRYCGTRASGDPVGCGVCGTCGGAYELEARW